MIETPETGRPGAITRLLAAYRAGDETAFDRLLPLVYDELRLLAASQLRKRAPDSTLDTTALVHEAYIKLSRQEGLPATDRSHFLGIAARAMRQIIVDHARERGAAKRGAGAPHVSIDGAPIVGAPIAIEQEAASLLALDEALHRLSQLNERLTRVVECRFFGGLSEEETAATLDVSTRTVQRDWGKARAWLRRELAANG